MKGDYQFKMVSPILYKNISQIENVLAEGHDEIGMESINKEYNLSYLMMIYFYPRYLVYPDTDFGI
jgi:hypothetical protein